MITCNGRYYQITHFVIVYMVCNVCNIIAASIIDNNDGNWNDDNENDSDVHTYIHAYKYRYTNYVFIFERMNERSQLNGSKIELWIGKQMTWTHRPKCTQTHTLTMCACVGVWKWHHPHWKFPYEIERRVEKPNTIGFNSLE